MHFSHSHQGSAAKATRIAVVAALHLAIGSVLVHQMNTRTFTMPKVFEDLTVDFRTPADPPPTPEPVQLETPQARVPELVVPIPEVDVAQSAEPTVRALHPQDALPQPQAAVAGAQTGTADARPAPLPAPAMRSAVLADANSCATPDYPARAARNGDTGTVTLALLVGANGAVLNSRILTSSGSRELDRAAQAALSLCAFKPAMENGVAQEGWARISYVWTLD